MVPWNSLSPGRKIALLVAAIFYIGAGLLHFIKPESYWKLMPPYIPWHHADVAISGVCEILGGIGLLIAQTRRAAAWGLVALLIAVFPANLYMATNPIETGSEGIPALIRWGRLPLQAVFIWWVLWCTTARPVNEFKYL